MNFEDISYEVITMFESLIYSRNKRESSDRSKNKCSFWNTKIFESIFTIDWVFADRCLSPWSIGNKTWKYSFEFCAKFFVLFENNSYDDNNRVYQYDLNQITARIVALLVSDARISFGNAGFGWST